jgi:hypothetical protein
MVNEINFEDVAPIVPVRNLEDALERYRKLGFSVHRYEGPASYGFAERGAVSLHLNEWEDHDPKRTGSVVCLYVSNADAVHAERIRSGVEGRFGDPTDTEYGLREFGFVDADGTLHRVGSRLPISPEHERQ